MKQALIEETNALLVEIRKESGLDQKDIAESIGISTPDLSRAKSYHPDRLGELSVSKRKYIIELLREWQNEQRPKGTEEQKAPVLETEIELYQLPFPRLRKTLVVASVGASILSFLLLFFFRDQLGYGNMFVGTFDLIVPVLFLSHLLGGVLIGWSAYYLLQLVVRYRSRQAGQKYIFGYCAVLFIGTIVLRGIKSRDSYLLCRLTNEDCNGLLGEPNFEVLGTALAVSTCGYGLMRFLLMKTDYSLVAIISQSVTFSVAAAALFSLTNEIYTQLIGLGLLTDKDSIISSAFFKFSFSHPERTPFILLWTFLGILVPLLMVREQIRGLNLQK